MNKKLEKKVLRFLDYSLKDIGWCYDELTPLEKEILSEKEFNKIRRKAFKTL